MVMLMLFWACMSTIHGAKATCNGRNGSCINAVSGASVLQAKISDGSRSNCEGSSMGAMCRTPPDWSNAARCDAQCHEAGYTCKGCVAFYCKEFPTDCLNTNCGSSYSHPSCAMGCTIGQLSSTVGECESVCDSKDGEGYWLFRAIQMNNNGGDDNCPGQNRRESTKEECKIGCQQAFQGTNINGPRMKPEQVIARVNQIRSHHGAPPMEWAGDKKEAADREAKFNAECEGCPPHACGRDDSCMGCDSAAGDASCSDLVDAVDRLYNSRWEEGPKDGTCDTQSHCGAIIDPANTRIVVGFKGAPHFFCSVCYF